MWHVCARAFHGDPGRAIGYEESVTHQWRAQGVRPAIGLRERGRWCDGEREEQRERTMDLIR